MATTPLMRIGGFTLNLHEFALIMDWEDRLRELAGLAEPERWRYVHVPNGRSNYPILRSYLQKTFMRLYEQNRVAVTERLACFNTGLMTPSQEEIFGLFTIADHYDPERPIGMDNKQWFLKGWFRAGDPWLTQLAELPTLASYWTDPSQLIFDPLLQLQLNVDHIVRDNLTRFPEELGGRLAANGVPQDLVDDAGDDDGDLAFEPPPNINRVVPLITRNALEGAIKHSLRLAQRSYRIAVPQFWWGRVQLLLPLYLRSATTADLALTLERNGNWYRAATVLYPDWAYGHARLLSRPNSEWLGGFRGDLTELVPGR
jgi:hypothetical protein